MTNEEHILICAVRYALGRKSYIVSIVCEEIREKQNKLSEKCVDIIINDISRHIDWCKQTRMVLGLECYLEDWILLRDVLAVELKCRGGRYD